MEKPQYLVQAEGVLLFLAGLFIYHQIGESWLLFAVLFVVPDLAILAYFVNNRVGGVCYNISHFPGWALMLAAYGWYAQQPFCYELAVIWGTHLAFDRMLGWGYKYPESFFHTHLGIKRIPLLFQKAQRSLPVE